MNKILTYISIIFFITTIVFILLWRMNVNKYKQTCELLTNAENKIETLTNDNNRLVEYISRKDIEIKDIEKKYKDKLKNIPIDQCGNTKPSKELLNYLKENM